MEKDLGKPLLDDGYGELGTSLPSQRSPADDLKSEFDQFTVEIERCNTETLRRSRGSRSNSKDNNDIKVELDWHSMPPRDALETCLKSAGRQDLLNVCLRFFDALARDGKESEAEEMVKDIVDRLRANIDRRMRATTKASSPRRTKTTPKLRDRALTDPLDLTDIQTAMAFGLRKFLEKLHRHHPKPPAYEIRFRDMGYRVKTTKSRGEITTVGSALKDLALCRKTDEQDVWIVKGLNGVLKPGTVTLVLGPPGCGKSTMLKALAGRIKVDHRNVQTGEILYNGQASSVFPVRKIAQYVQQTEVHLPQLTVRETFDFAKTCLTHKINSDDPVVKRASELKTEMIMYILGLRHTADTVVGNAVLRGVSGGERRRVTLGELCMGNAQCFCLDQISTGLDSAATFDIVQSLKTYAEVFDSTIIMSLLQPPPEVFDLFDNICVLDQGQCIYFGPRVEILPYFKSIGYVCPPRKDVADFLQEVSHPVVGKQYQCIKSATVPIPSSTSEFVECFNRSQRAVDTSKELSTAPEFKPLTEFEKMLMMQDFALSPRDAIRNCLFRQTKITFRNLAFIRVRLMQNIIMGVLVGTLFYDLSDEDYGLRYGLCFFSCLFLAMGNMATVPEQMSQRNVFYKQQAAGFFPTQAYALAVTLLQIPFTLVECFIFSTLVYWLTGLTDDSNGMHYFVFYLLNVMLTLAMSAYFRLLAFACPDMNTAQPIAGFSVVVFMVFAGYLVTYDSIPPYWIWAYYVSPLKWTLTALMVNEFRSDKFDEHLTDPADPSQELDKTLGESYLEAYDFPTGKEEIAYGFLVLAAFYAGFTMLSVMALHYLRVDTSIAAPAIAVTEASSDKDSKKKVCLPFTPVTLSFHRLRYFVPMPGEAHGQRLMLLNNVSGYAKPGTLTALMGSSGAGKTTLLDVIAGRKTGGEIEGRILLNGQPKDQETFCRIAGYVEQMDVHSPMQTVREALEFSACLRLPAEVTQADRAAFVDEVIEMLELGPITKSLIGTKETGGLSVEAAKRVTIGVELVANPSILFLDEPTSGLDSRAAQLVMRAVQNIAKTGRSILCTIHQPSVEIFELFDNLLLLKRGGEVVYFGPLGNQSKTLISYFESIPDSRTINPGENPATYMLECIGAGVGNVVNRDFALEWAESDQNADREEELDDMEVTVSSSAAIHFDSPYASDFQTQLRALIVRQNRSYWRSPNYNVTRMVMDALIALVFGSVYFDNEYDTVSGAVSRVGAIYVTAVFAGVLNLVTVLPVMVVERSAFYRERAGNMYGALPYSIASGVVELPYLVATSLLFVSIFYWMIGFENDLGKFLFYWLVFALYTGMQTFFGQFLAVWAPNLEVAQIIGPAFVSLWNLFCGFMIPEPEIPQFWKFLHWLSPPRYVLESLVTDQFHCEGNCNDCTCVDVPLNEPPYSVRVTAYDFVTDYYGFDYDKRYGSMVVLVIFVIFLRVMTLVGLRFVSHLKR